MNDTINRYLAILCYPFASLDFFLEDYFEEILSGEEGAEEKLRAEIIRYVQKNCSIYSYDEIYMYLEKCYLYDLKTKKYQQISQLYLGCLDKIVQSLISQRDGKIVFKYWKNHQEEDFLGGFGDSNKIFLFHSMNMHMSLDFIIMLYMAQNEDNDIRSLNNYYNQIEVADQQLAGILKAGVAENHLHKGVSVSFFEIWEAFMMPLSNFAVKEIDEGKFELGDGKTGYEEELFYILTAAIVRMGIALALREYFWKEDSRQAGLLWEEKPQRLMNLFENGKGLGDFYREQWGNIEAGQARHEILFYFQNLWNDIQQMLPALQEGSTLIRAIFQVPEDVHTSDETIFLFYAMKYLKKQGMDNTGTREEKQRFIKCIFQYLRVKNYVFGCIVQKKSIRGLDYFQEKYYERDSALNKFCGKLSGGSFQKEDKIVYWEQAMRKQFHNRDLKKIEFRTSIDINEAEFRRGVRDFLAAYRNIIEENYCRKTEDGYVVERTFPKVGLVFHLIKEKDKSVPDKCFLDGIDEKDKLQFGRLESKYEEQIVCMCKLRSEIPGLDRYLVGLDAASLENATPVWVFVKAFERARDSSIEKIGYNGNGIRSLRFTFHAGEDFRHILSGLRRVDEAVTFLKFHAGDRIGHGTALGILPEQWQRYNPFVVLPRIEALENYIWAHNMLSQNMVESADSLNAYIERRVYELARGIYGNAQNIPFAVLKDGYLRMFHMEHLYYDKCKDAKDAGFCEEVRGGRCEEILWNGQKIAYSRHCRKFLTEMERPINYVVTEQDIRITEMLQKLLREKLSRNGIVIEVNPSSNVAIGEVDKITDNQIYHLNRPGGEGNVMVCINSDDPTVFHTNVSNELAYIYYGMLYNGVSRETTLEWIDKIRVCGLKSSFLQQDDTDQQVYKELKKIIEAL